MEKSEKMADRRHRISPRRIKGRAQSSMVKVLRTVQKNWKPLNKEVKDEIQRVVKQVMSESKSANSKENNRVCEEIKKSYSSILVPTTDTDHSCNNADYNNNTQIDVSVTFEDSRTINKEISDVKRQLDEGVKNNERLISELSEAREKLDSIYEMRTNHRLLKTKINTLHLPSPMPYQ